MSDHASGARSRRLEGPPGEISAVGFVNILLRHRRLMVLLPVFLGVAGAVYGAVTRRTIYRSESSFKVEAAVPDAGSAALGLANRLGLGSPITAGGESLDLYLYLVETRRILTEVLETSVGASLNEGSGSSPSERRLLDLLPIEEEDPATRLNVAVEYLRSVIVPEAEFGAGLVHLTVEAGTPELALAINRRILERLVEFNLRGRQFRSGAEREFIEKRLAEAHRRLLEAETDLRAFLDANRGYESSPQLVFEMGRLQREVDLRSELYRSLALSHEEARIEEARDVPALTIVEPPVTAVESGHRGWLVGGVIGVVLGLVLALTVGFAREFLRRQIEAHPNDYLEFQALLDQTRGSSPSKSAEVRSSTESDPLSRQHSRIDHRA